MISLVTHPKKKKAPTVEDRVSVIVKDEIVGMIARCTKRLFAELSDDEVKEGISSLLGNLEAALDTIPKILGPKLTKEVGKMLQKVSIKVKETQRMPEKKLIKKLKEG
ncbi:hypothetical protein ES703_00011 [subsurface metagenome]